jgi:hypothetical protein
LHPYRLLLIVGLILISGFRSSGVSYAAGPPPSLDDYWQKVEQTQAVIAGLADASPETSRARLSTLAREWAAITQVRLPSGSLLPLDHSFLVTQLRADPPNLDRLEQLLANLLTARTDWPPPKHTAADLNALEPILARPEFQWPPERPSPLAALWRWFLEYLWKLIAPFLPERALISFDSNLINYALTALGVLILILVIGFILRELLASMVTEAAIADQAGAIDEVLTADTAFQQAQRLSGDGDYRSAVRYLYLSALLLLDERGLLRYERSQTNREYLRKIAHLPQLVGILGDVIEVFDRVWYGYQPLDEAAYAKYAARVAELRQQK